MGLTLHMCQASPELREVETTTSDFSTYQNNNDNMTNLDLLLLKGASSSNPEEGLQELRYTILTKGIPANSEGMVRPLRHLFMTL